MKQLGNLAIVCAKRPEILLQLYAGNVSVFVGAGPDMTAFTAPWENDSAIDHIIHELNFGAYRTGKEEKAA